MIEELMKYDAHPSQAYASIQNHIRVAPFQFVTEHVLVPVCIRKDETMLRQLLDHGAPCNPIMGFTNQLNGNVVEFYRESKDESLNNFHGTLALFTVCAREKWTRGIEILMEYGLPVNATFMCGRISFVYTVLKHDLSTELKQKIMSSNPILNITTSCGKTLPLLAYAILQKSVPVVKALLSIQQDTYVNWKSPVNDIDSCIGYLTRPPPNAKDGVKYVKAESKAIEILDILMKYKFNLNTSIGVSNTSCVLMALRSGWKALAKALVDHGADVYGVTGCTQDIVYELIHNAEHLTVEMLANSEIKYDYSRLHFYNKTPTMEADVVVADDSTTECIPQTVPHLFIYLLGQLPELRKLHSLPNVVRTFLHFLRDSDSIHETFPYNGRVLSFVHFAMSQLSNKLEIYTPLMKLLFHSAFEFNLNLSSMQVLGDYLNSLYDLIQDKEEADNTLQFLLAPIVTGGYDFTSVDVHGCNFYDYALTLSNKDVFTRLFNNLHVVRVNKEDAMIGVKGYRGRVFSPIEDPRLVSVRYSYKYYDDGMILVKDGHILDVDEASVLLAKYPNLTNITEYKNKMLMPGFIDTHIHFPQMNVVGSYGEQLLEWLNMYTFPSERKFEDMSHAVEHSKAFIKELLRNGTTSALVFCTVHKQSVDAFFTEASKFNLRMIAGKVLMDRNCPPYLQDTAETGYADSKELIQRWHGKNRLHYAVTPRFAPTSTPQQLDTASELLREFKGLYMHTHISENPNEIEWVLDLFPQRKSYLDVYDHHRLLGPRAVLAHGVHLNSEDCDRLAETGSAVSFCPTSNLFLGSGLFNLREMESKDVRVGLGSDVGGGTHFCHITTLNEAYKVLQLQKQKLSAFKGFYLATLGGARALYLDDKIGSLEVGKEADFVVVDLDATELMTMRMSITSRIEEVLFALMMMGDDRTIASTFAFGEEVYTNTTNLKVEQA